MSNETQRTCRNIECNAKINFGGVETAIGWFCSEKCRQAIVKRIFRVLAFPPKILPLK